tara:strand:- start:1142 stop:1288 length:147 start_codon:yes stop_codon:yes gene_type:complete
MDFLYKNWEVFDLNKEVLKMLKQKYVKPNKKLYYLNVLNFDSGLTLSR